MKERRAFPRYPITFSVTVALSGPDGEQKFDSECVDISRSSIQVSCDNELVEALLAQDEYPHTAKLAFSIPGDSEPYAVQSQVVTHRRLAQNHYYLVLVFNDFSEGSDGRLEEDLKEFEPGGFKMDSA